MFRRYIQDQGIYLLKDGHGNPHYTPKIVWLSSQVFNVYAYTNKTMPSKWIEAQH